MFDNECSSQIQDASFIISAKTAALSLRKSASGGMSPVSCCTHRYDKRNTL